VSISVVLLAYDEAENLEIILPQITDIVGKMNVEYEIIIVDSPKSKDNTKDVAKKFGAKYYLQDGNCYADAFKTGIRCATKNYMLVLDADGSHNPLSIPDIYNKINEGYDMVIGSRYTENGITHDYKIQILMSKVLNLIMRVCIGVKARDISTSFRMYKSELLKKIELNRKNFDVLQEVILKMKFIKKDFTIGEVPIVFEKRMKGTSKRKLFKYIISYLFSACRFIALRIKNIF